MKTVIGAIVAVLILGTTDSFAQSRPSVTAVITFFTGDGRDINSSAVDIQALDGSNMYECTRNEDGFPDQDARNNYVYKIRILWADDGILKISGGSFRAGSSAYESFLYSPLPMPTAYGPGHINFSSGFSFSLSKTSVSYVIAVWTYPTEKQLAEKIIKGARRELSCSLKTRDEMAKTLSISNPYGLYEK